MLIRPEGLPDDLRDEAGAGREAGSRCQGRPVRPPGAGRPALAWISCLRPVGFLRKYCEGLSVPLARVSLSSRQRQAPFGVAHGPPGLCGGLEAACVALCPRLCLSGTRAVSVYVSSWLLEEESGICFWGPALVLFGTETRICK